MSQYALFLGKAVRSAARLRGGGTALPGLVVEKVDPGFMRRTLGNNGEDGTEDAVRANVIGTYLHGPLLPKNPAVADLLIERAVHRELEPLMWPVDQVAALSRQVAERRPR